MLPKVEILEERRMFSSIPTTTAHLVFQQQPSDSHAGAKMSPAIVVALENSSGSLLTEDHAIVSLRLALQGTKKVLVAQARAENGLAVFRGIRVTRAGPDVVDATSSGLVSVQSDTFTITPGTAVRMYVNFWSFAADGVNYFELVLLDRFGNIATGDTSTISVRKGSLGEENGVPLANALQAPVLGGRLFGVIWGKWPDGNVVIFNDSNTRLRPLMSPPWSKFIDRPPYPDPDPRSVF